MRGPEIDEYEYEFTISGRTDTKSTSIRNGNVNLAFRMDDRLHYPLKILVTCNIQSDLLNRRVLEAFHGRELARCCVDFAFLSRKLFAAEMGMS